MFCVPSATNCDCARLDRAEAHNIFARHGKKQGTTMANPGLPSNREETSCVLFYQRRLGLRPLQHAKAPKRKQKEKSRRDALGRATIRPHSGHVGTVVARVSPSKSVVLPHFSVTRSHTDYFYSRGEWLVRVSQSLQSFED